jgi:thioredoxin-like negative regulator of GroEL
VVESVQGKYEGAVDFVIYGEVNSDSAAGQFASQHGVSAIPTMVVVDPDGNELDRLIGRTDEAGLRAFIDRAVAQ